MSEYYHDPPDRDYSPSFENLLFNEHSPDYDEVAHDLFMEGVMEDNQDAYDELVEYLDYYYDIDFEGEWDWADFYERP